MRSRKVLTLGFLVLLLSVGYYSMTAAPVKSEGSYSYHGPTKWHTNVTEAMQIAESKDKPVLVYFWTTWCTYCEDYNEHVYTDPAVQSELDQFVLLAINLDSGRPAATRLVKRYNVNYPPQHVVLTPDGRVVRKLPGYAPRAEFLSYLREAQTEYRS
ncbi:MAG: thioredoxin family protein [Halodesulfurarchaeum sp.]